MYREREKERENQINSSSNELLTLLDVIEEGNGLWSKARL